MREKFKSHYNLWFNTENELLNQNIDKKKDFFLCTDLKNKNTIFPLTPLFKKKKDNIFNLNKNTKIVYIAEVNINVNDNVNNFWKKNKEKILSNLILINDHNYIKEVFFDGNKEGYENYIQLKNLLRFELISSIHKFFKDRLLLVGTDWIKLGFPSKKIDYKTSFRKKIYSNNICLDFGSKSGTNSLYPRSVEILENNGFLLQAEQNDTNMLKNSNISNFDYFKSKNQLLDKINELLNSNKKIKINNFDILENKFINFLESINERQNS